jgi:hypothetical protein
MTETIERAAFAAFKSDFIGHRGETAEGEWKRFAGTGYHKRWLIITRAALAETFDTTGDEMWEAVQTAAEKALREDVDDPGLAITRAVFDAMSKIAASSPQGDDVARRNPK